MKVTSDEVRINTVEAAPRVKVLVCGGRQYGRFWRGEHERLRCELDSLHAQIGITDLAHGDAEGADTMAGLWAEENGILVHKFPADWKKYGQAAGIQRNGLMYRVFKPDLVVAFPGGNGTANMCKVATLGGTHVKYIR